MADESKVRPTALQRAKDTLLRALDALEKGEAELGQPPDFVELVVVYSIGVVGDEDGDFHEIGGWSATPGPHWSQAALLRRAATAFEGENPIVQETDEDEEEE